MIIKREVCKCEVCGHEWIAEGEGLPKQCPKRGCRSSKWNSGNFGVMERPRIPDVNPVKELGDIFKKQRIVTGMDVEIGRDFSLDKDHKKVKELSYDDSEV